MSRAHITKRTGRGLKILFLEKGRTPTLHTHTALRFIEVDIFCNLHVRRPRMRIQMLPRYPGVFLKHNLGSDERLSKLLDRRCALSRPDTKINQVMTLYRKEGGLCGNNSFRNINNPCLGEGMMQKSHHFPAFYVVRDDLLHPFVNGNKARKLDAIIPVLEDNAATDVVDHDLLKFHVALLISFCLKLRILVINLGDMSYVSVNFNVLIILNGNKSNVALLGTHID